ncbi:transcriptional regulator NrdR [Wenzhouxiangella sp. EGI_FJ10409]|uniref:transcriptional regulator NrdR n=1 Tax=Wenzhouxiangella sp. EGI_FJ10409 TaxID=3243767 RepID=UPI0035DDF887
MWCPFCNHTDTRVVDSRLASDGFQIRRRRECAACGARFNTLETPALKAPNVIKSDGSREAFDEDKLRRGMLKALEKRPVETQLVERAIRKLVREVRTLEESEISSQQLGDWVAAELSRLDKVAYVRFASVYRRFEDVQAFREEIEKLERDNPGIIDRRQIPLLDEDER